MRLSTLLMIAAATAALGSSGQGLHKQCGGDRWTGCTMCKKGLVCTYVNPHLSRCLRVRKGYTPWSSSSTTDSGSDDQTQRQDQTQSKSGVSPNDSTNNSGNKNLGTNPDTTNNTGNKDSGTNPDTTNNSGNNSGTNTDTTNNSGNKHTSTNTDTNNNPGNTNNPGTTNNPSPPDNQTPALTTIGTTLSATMTYYGGCLTTSAACSWYTNPGYSAAVSQNVYGAKPGDGPGPACGTCWQLTGEKDSNGNKLTNAGTIIVMVNNLCPEGDPLCSQQGLTGTNKYGANANFDLCDDSGAAQAFFGNKNIGLAVGTATQVDCSLWSGAVVKKSS